MAIIQVNGKVIDIWFTGARRHEMKALRQRLYYSGYLRKLFRKCKVLGDKAYKGLKQVEICETKEQRSKRQKIETSFSKLRYLEYNGWRTFKTFLIYLTAIIVTTYFPL